MPRLASHDPKNKNLPGNQDSEEIAIRDLAEMIVGLTASRSRIVSKPLPLDHPRQPCPDITKAKSLLEWQPKVPPADGLKETIAYFRHLLGRASRQAALRRVVVPGLAWSP